MDWAWLDDAIKMVLGVIFGVGGKVVYDRRFAKKPELGYIFGPRATFGKETVYQNLQASNAGTETTNDVRINFSLPNFDLVEHQVSYDGPYSFDRTTDRTSLVIPSLPPGDSVTFSFVFTLSKSPVSKIQDLFLSARSRDCVAKPLDRSKAATTDWISLAILIGVFGLGRGAIINALTTQKATQSLRDQAYLSLEQIEKLKKQSSELANLVRLQLQVPNPVAPGTQFDIQCYVENTSENPFDGRISVSLPVWAGAGPMEPINVGAKNRKVFKWMVKVSRDVPSGNTGF